MFNAALNNRLSVLSGYYAAIDREEQGAKEILSTYEGLLAQFNNGEGADYLFPHMARWEAELVQLAADRAEIDRLWNEALLAAEGA